MPYFQKPHGYNKSDSLSIGFTTSFYAKERLENEAKQDRRSLSSLLNKIIYEHFDRQDAEKKNPGTKAGKSE